MTNHLILPHGGALANLLVDETRALELPRRLSREWLSWDLTPRQLCDLELLLSGGFSPLRGFMSQAEYSSVRDHARLPDSTLWPIPITLDVPEEFAGKLYTGAIVALRDPEGMMLAALHVSDIFPT